MPYSANYEVRIGHFEHKFTETLILSFITLDTPSSANGFSK